MAKGHCSAGPRAPAADFTRGRGRPTRSALLDGAAPGYGYNPNMAWRTGCLLSILTALPLRADMLIPRGPGGLGGVAVLIGLILALAVIAGGIWWVRRRRKRT